MAGKELEGPVPHESPIAMTLPLGVLGFFAVFGGFLGAHAIGFAPLFHFLEPVVKTADDLVSVRAGFKPAISGLQP